MKSDSRAAAQAFPSLLLALLLAGCSVPEYMEPKGFSSTFHRRLYGDRIAAPAEVIEAPPLSEGDRILRQGSSGPQLMPEEWTRATRGTPPAEKRYPIASNPPVVAR